MDLSNASGCPPCYLTPEELATKEKEYAAWISGLKYCCKDFKNKQINHIVYYAKHKWHMITNDTSVIIHHCP